MIGIASGLLLAAALGVVELPATGSEAKQMFLDRCKACHVAPDAQFEVDRAWLEQVKSTA